MGYLSADYLLQPASGDFRFLWPALVFFVLCPLIATCYGYFVDQTNNKRAPVTRMAQRVTGIAWVMGVIGLVLVLFRWGDAHIPLVGSRLLMYLAALAFAVLLAYVLWFLRYELPKRNAAYESTLLRRQYQPRSRRRH